MEAGVWKSSPKQFQIRSKDSENEGLTKQVVSFIGNVGEIPVQETLSRVLSVVE